MAKTYIGLNIGDAASMNVGDVTQNTSDTGKDIQIVIDQTHTPDNLDIITTIEALKNYIIYTGEAIGGGKV